MNLIDKCSQTNEYATLEKTRSVHQFFADDSLLLSSNDFFYEH